MIRVEAEDVIETIVHRSGRNIHSFHGKKDGDSSSNLLDVVIELLMRSVGGEDVMRVHFISEDFCHLLEGFSYMTRFGISKELPPITPSESATYPWSQGRKM